eukprot:357902-Chlamydomonas_euryale.AAC.21
MHLRDRTPHTDVDLEPNQRGRSGRNNSTFHEGRASEARTGDVGSAVVGVGRRSKRPSCFKPKQPATRSSVLGRLADSVVLSDALLAAAVDTLTADGGIGATARFKVKKRCTRSLNLRW